MILSYILIIGIVMLTYFSVTNKVVVKDIVAILSGLTIALGLINYIGVERRNKVVSETTSKKDYIDNISSTFIKIDSLYLQYPDELRDLFYEFYGFNDFPQSDQTPNPTPSTSTNPPNSTPVSDVIIEKRKKPIGTTSVISSKEFICIHLILEYLSNMFLINPEIFSELKIRQRIACYTQSNKLKYVLSSVKENYSVDFIKALDSQQLIMNSELDSENINIPYLYKVSKM
jgi:hypothetical protein